MNARSLCSSLSSSLSKVVGPACGRHTHMHIALSTGGRYEKLSLRRGSPLLLVTAVNPPLGGPPLGGPPLGG
eukprot:CAMPEP_0174699014 /NCGR_PEP_ID=MMETSP1094-20130205/4430_1 /TAXON_ID=156173 /ORGANISM="Chrysochromulina brevifilum, Strain UTEX LB 985" /LENGTH=71 /DNA_ID=CAMNT_0015896271 /DNA_START=509 /DNA_END=720 /DNA_ORIENTATION=+